MESNRVTTTEEAEDSTYRELRHKNEITLYAKKKVKKVTRMVEDLVRSYFVMAKDKHDHRLLAQGLPLDGSLSNDYSEDLKKWVGA